MIMKWLQEITVYPLGKNSHESNNRNNGGSLQISSWTTNKGMNFFKGNDRLLIKFYLSCI